MRVGCPNMQKHHRWAGMHERGEEAFRRAAVFVRGERNPEPARGGKGGAAGGVLLSATVCFGGVPVP